MKIKSLQETSTSKFCYTISSHYKNIQNKEENHQICHYRKSKCCMIDKHTFTLHFNDLNLGNGWADDISKHNFKNINTNLSSALSVILGYAIDITVISFLFVKIGLTSVSTILLLIFDFRPYTCFFYLYAYFLSLVHQNETIIYNQKELNKLQTQQIFHKLQISKHTALHVYKASRPISLHTNAVHTYRCTK